LTGGADTGVQFARHGCRVLLLSPEILEGIDLERYSEYPVLVLNTRSRGLKPEDAHDRLVRGLKQYDRKLFPIVYKKIDSTLRGNIGTELDAVLIRTGNPLAFLTPAYPEQQRFVLGGLLMVGTTPVSLTEASRDPTSPVTESCVARRVAAESRFRVGSLDMTVVASPGEILGQTIGRQREKGTRIVTFDASSRADLLRIAGAALRIDPVPVLAGSAGLAAAAAEVVYGCMTPTAGDRPVAKRERILIVSGSATRVAENQIARIERNGAAVFEIGERDFSRDPKDLSVRAGAELRKRDVVIRGPVQRIEARFSGETPAHLQIENILGTIAGLSLARSGLPAARLALFIVGGDTAMRVIERLGADSIEIEREILPGVPSGMLRGGKWDRLRVITKAGGFGDEDAIARVLARAHGA
jgi:D-threonate/D-erythronate kinase